jgi:hypothetical protein
MRRNSENLLVLAGHELSRRWSRPVALVDVLRAAASEIEQYERVTLNVQPGISIRTEAVSDVVHLTAELVENATSFSAADTPVTLAGYMQRSGWALIEVTDQGVGMGAEEMAHANWRLANPPVVDVAVSRRMGLFVVARLAARHGIRVRLCPVPSGGIIAQVWVPDEAITREKSSPGPLRSVSATSGNQAVATTVGKLEAGIEETGHVMPMREAGRDAGIRRDSIAPTPRTASLREDLDMADSGQRPLADGPARNAEPQAATGPRPRIGDYLRGAEPGAGFGPRATEPGQGGGDQRTGGPSAARAGALSGAAAGEHLRAYAGAAGRGEGTPAGEVIVPAADGLVDHQRLPIFDAVESDWFRRGRRAVGRIDQSSGGWSSPADDGWRAAEVVHAPTSDGTMPSGLPKRLPKANLVPGTAAVSAASEPTSGTLPGSAPGRSAEETRDRFGAFQRGIRRARTAAGGNPGSGESTTS